MSGANRLCEIVGGPERHAERLYRLGAKLHVLYVPGAGGPIYTAVSAAKVNNISA